MYEQLLPAKLKSISTGSEEMLEVFKWTFGTRAKDEIKIFNINGDVISDNHISDMFSTNFYKHVQCLSGDSYNTLRTFERYQSVFNFANTNVSEILDTISNLN